MKLPQEVLDQLMADLENVKSYDDLMGKNGAIKKLIKSSIEKLLDAELTNHLGYPKDSPIGNNSGNSRNGKRSKTIISENGKLEINIPRDRNSTFDPVLIEKYKRTVGPIEDKIISMYAKGMTTRDIQSHIEEIYGLDISPTTISNITNAMVDHARQWQDRALQDIYTIVYFDAIHYKVRLEGKVVSKAAYTCLGVDIEGHKDLLGLWIGEAEGANFWLAILTELRNRGVKDILISCVDGLKGFPEAIESVFPECQVQQCVIHQIRNTIKYVASKNQKEFLNDLKLVYKAPTEKSALAELDNLEAKWGKKYPYPINSWRKNWANLSAYFKYPEEIRTLIYTTNPVENVHRQFRKVTKSKSLFPNDDALLKILYLSYIDLSKKWSVPIRNWSFIFSQLSIFFDERLKPFI